MDHVSVVVDDLKAVKAVFVDLGMEVEGQAPGSEENGLIESTGSINVRVDIAMMRTLDGRGRLELMKFHSPAVINAERATALGDTLVVRSTCSPSTTSTPPWLTCRPAASNSSAKARSQDYGLGYVPRTRESQPRTRRTARLRRHARGSQ